jgi:hypothetical protein
MGDEAGCVLLHEVIQLGLLGCAAWRLNAGPFVWPRVPDPSTPLSLTQPQFDALVLGLP